MNIRGILLIALSLLLGFIAIGWVQRQAGSSGAGPATTTVVVANSTINFAKHIGMLDVHAVEWPADAVPKGAFAKVDDVASATTDRVALRVIEAGEPILASMVSGSGGKASLSTVIDKDMRAVTIHVTDATGVAGFVSPGDRVDILLTRGVQGGGMQERDPGTDILLQNIKVLGIDQDTNQRNETPTVAKVVTLEVTPEDGQKLTLGGQVGTLSLALRNFANPDQITSRTLSLVDLRADQPKPAEAAPARPPAPARPQTVSIIRGTELTHYELQRGGAVPVAAKAAAN
jgi:pilus assembly protein CpaB